MPKVQGEGDYESARRYNTRTRSFMKKAGKSATRRATGGVDEGALRKAKSKAKAAGQDARDATVLRNLEKKRSGSGARAASGTASGTRRASGTRTAGRTAARTTTTRSGGRGRSTARPGIH